MRTNARIFCKVFAETFDAPGPVYEFGSFLYPEQAVFADMRPFFKGKEFVGCDVAKGAGVDRVENLESLSLPDGSVGTAIALETMEHVENIQKAFSELYRVIKDKGMLVICSPFIFPIHDLPNDYWRFTPKGLAHLMKGFRTKLIGTHADPEMPHTVYGIGFKGIDRSEISGKADMFIERFKREVAPVRKASYKISLFAKGLLRGRGYVEKVLKRHHVEFKYY
jgi:SAM-dependent methyltransferase